MNNDENELKILKMEKLIIIYAFVGFRIQIMHIYDEFKSSFIIIFFLSYIFLVSGLIINFFQLCSCIIWPFNKALFRKINCYLALGIWSREYYFIIITVDNT
jgi:hypothetical protein